MTSPRAPSVPAPGTRPTVGNVTLRFGTDAAGRPHSALRLVHVMMPCVRPPSPPSPREGNRGADVSSPNGRPSTVRAVGLDPPRESGLPWPDAASSLGSLTLRACEAAGGAGRGSGARARGSRTHLDSFGGLVTRRQPAARATGTARCVRRPRPSWPGRPPMSRGLAPACRICVVCVEGSVPGRAAPAVSSPGHCPPLQPVPRCRPAGCRGHSGPRWAWRGRRTPSPGFRPEGGLFSGRGGADPQSCQ